MAKTFQRSFAAGEITPELYSRLDLRNHQTGVAKALNFWTLPHGPAQNRSGTIHVLEAKDSTRKVRLVPFEYNTEQTYELEFGHNYIRIHSNAGTLLEATVAISGIVGSAVTTSGAHSYSTGDWVYIGTRYHKITVTGATTFTTADLWGVATTASGTTAARVYTVTTTYTEDQIFELTYTQSADVLSICHPDHAPAELRRLSAASWSLAAVSFVPTITAPTTPTGATGGPGGGTAIDHYYKTTAVASDTLEESLGSTASAAVSFDLTVAGNYIDVDPTPGGVTVTGAVRYNVYKLLNGLYGYIGQTDGSTLRDNNITPDVSKSPAINEAPFTGTGNYPGAVGYAESRRVFAGTDNKPQNFWLTRSGTESNISYSIPTRDDDRIAGRIVARKVHRIRHILPLADLCLLTSGGEWRLTPMNSDILTPTSVDPDPVSNEGANFVTPVLTGTAGVYADRGGRIRALDYHKDKEGNPLFTPRDLCVMAPHLFVGYTIADMAYAQAPYKMIFAVRSDGKLLCLTYLPEHEVTAWSVHETEGGLFESVCAVSEGTETAVYVVVKRTVNARSVRYIERLSTRQFATLADCYFVDAGVTYDGAATTSITGLYHLEGETVSILADGAVHAQRVVTAGAITLDEAASVVHIGIPITADLQTLPLAVEAESAFGQGSGKNIGEVAMRVIESSGINAGPTFEELRELPVRTNEPYGSPPALRTGMVDLSLDPAWSTEGQLCVRQTHPLPLTISSLTLTVAVGG